MCLAEVKVTQRSSVGPMDFQSVDSVRISGWIDLADGAIFLGVSTTNEKGNCSLNAEPQGKTPVGAVHINFVSETNVLCSCLWINTTQCHWQDHNTSVGVSYSTQNGRAKSCWVWRMVVYACFLWRLMTNRGGRGPCWGCIPHWLKFSPALFPAVQLGAAFITHLWQNLSSESLRLKHDL